MITHEAYEAALQTVRDYRAQCQQVIIDADAILEAKYDKFTTIHEAGFSNRVFQALMSARFDKNTPLYYLSTKSEYEFMSLRGFGKGCLVELREKLWEVKLLLRK